MGGEARYALFVPVDGEWVAGCDQHIKAQVKFEAVQQVWVRNVLLNDITR